MRFQCFDIKSYNTYMSPYLLQDGDMIQSLNMDNFPVGGKTKRPGYTAILGTSTGSEVTNLIDWHRNDGTTFNLYKYSGSLLEYSTQGTGAWTVCGNGTFSPGADLGYTVMNDVMIIGDGVGSTRHSTNGTSFTNTTIAPIGGYFTNYGNRVYLGGTASTLFWSSLGDATNWSSAGTSDSSSIDIPDAGRINCVIKVTDRVIVTKNSGVIYKWDAYNLTDMVTSLAPTSSRSIGEVEDYKFFLNRLGFFGFGGDKPQLISNPIRRLIYNDQGLGIAGTTFERAPGVTHQYNYYCTVGTVTDDLTEIAINDAISKYDYQQNRWGLYKFNNKPTAWVSYRDNNQVQQLAFGDSGGQVYQMGGAQSDNGVAIESVMQFVITAGSPDQQKEWKPIQFTFNPGNQAKVQVAAADVFLNANLTWQDLGDCSSGVAYFTPSGLRSRLLFVRIYEASTTSRFTFYGFSGDATIIQK